MDAIILIAKGIFVGFVIAAPVGPVGILCIHRTLHLSLAAGLLAGLGAAFADTIFGAVAAFGLSFVADFFLTHESWLRLVGGILLVAIGVETMLKKTPKAQTGDDEDDDPKHPHYFSSFIRTFMLTITNPITILAFGPIFVAADAVVKDGDLVAAWTLIAGVFAGSQLWWMMLCTGTHFGRRHITESRMQWVNRVSGVIIVMFGVMAVASLTPVGKMLFGNGNSAAQTLERTLGVGAGNKDKKPGATAPGTAKPETPKPETTAPAPGGTGAPQPRQ